MNPTNQETRADMISEIIDGLSNTQKIVFLTIYFDNYTWEGLKSLLGLLSSNYDKVGTDQVP